MLFADFPEGVTRRVRLLELIASGVKIPCEDGVLITEDCVIGAGTLILPGCVIGGGTVIGADCVVGPGSVLLAARLGDGVEFLQSWAEDARVEDGARIGPFARLRPGAHIGMDAKIGNFVEIKNSVIGQGSKVPHLSYIGDTDMGTGCNIGCGCATANYDGRNKHRTRLGAGCFIGCDTTLVAPVTLGERAFTAAGSVVTQDVPDGVRVFARARQVNKHCKGI
ncbi:MAG: UDP-N-acetylglucosamine diphosphorylase [Oscillospiraceae bacterium]|jgi:bifunctional UDP-N-acetylglucosamine pyrophosphorylase/glucosamine-1-phosphate N-acetyltransferase|nr:UDP-N-acetylglucosamine diphosphorylase [Oscillospiraceae bacterium]